VPGPAPHRRLIVGGALALAAAAALLVWAVTLGGADGTPLHAQPISPPRAAPPTRGTDSDGRSVSVPVSGRPAIVTFLYTHCPDICPLTAQEISQALTRAGARASDIDVVAISVDPAGDTPAAAKEFLARHGLTGRMRYVVGTRGELRPLWSSWQIAAQADGPRSIAHSARVVLVDRDGRQVGAYSTGVPIDIEDLAADIRTLIG
jgi:protein SCO1/2